MPKILESGNTAPLIVAAAIVDSRGRVLAAQRSYPASLEGQWEFPGGKVEEGEEPSVAVVREIEEELGVKIVLGRIVARQQYPNRGPGSSNLGSQSLQPGTQIPASEQSWTEEGEDQLDTHWIGRQADQSGPNCEDWPLPNGSMMRLWIASTKDVPQAGSSHSQVKWLAADELNSVPWLPGDLPILPVLREYLSEGRSKAVFS